MWWQTDCGHHSVGLWHSCRAVQAMPGLTGRRHQLLEYQEWQPTGYAACMHAFPTDAGSTVPVTACNPSSQWRPRLCACIPAVPSSFGCQCEQLSPDHPAPGDPMQALLVAHCNSHGLLAAGGCTVLRKPYGWLHATPGVLCTAVLMRPVDSSCLQALEQLIARYCDTHPSQLDAAVEKELTRQRDVVEIKNTLLKHRVREASKATKQVSPGEGGGGGGLWLGVWGALCRGSDVQLGDCTGAVLI